MDKQKFSRIFSRQALKKIFPPSKTERFFEALFGDPEEGAYDIELKFNTLIDNRLEFEFQLKQRPGRCLACNLTYGLPQVFQRHPIIDVEGIITKISEMIPEINITGWELGYTKEISPSLHVIPLTLFFIKEEN